MFKKLMSKKKKKDKHSLQNQNSNHSESNGSAMNGNGAPTINHTDSDHYTDDNNMPPNPTNISKQSHSHDDMSADDIKKKQQKFAKKGGKKRHSHIGVMRHHPNKNGKTKNGKSLHVPGDIKEEDEDNDNDNNNTKKLKNGTSNHSKNGSSTMTSASTMANSKATNKRLEQLMAMRAGKDAKGNRSRSVNVSKQKEKENKYPKKRRSEVHKEPRRHSMFPDKEKNKEIHDKHLKDRRKTIEKNHKLKKVQYRVKNELFVLYDYYQPVRIIGSGAYAVVCEAINTLNGKKCAVKKNKGVFDHITDARRILREIKLLMHFNHQDIISLVDVIPCDSTDIDTFNDVYLIMPKMETTLAKVIRSRQKLTDRHYQFFMYQMLRGLNYMHSANVIHRDLKPENILINGADCNVKITDFGLARGVCKDENIEKPTEYVVTRWYRSPEVMCSAGFYDESVDIWSLGCIFAELILRRPLFPGQNYLDQLKIIFEVMGTPKDLTWIKTPEAKRWVQKLKPHNGKPLKQVFEKASDGALELLSVMLTMDPNHRYSALQCLRHPYLKELHRDEDEQTCPPFDLSFEFEKAIKTKFGVRHMMYDALIQFQRDNPQKYHKKSNPNGKSSKSSKDDHKNDK